MDFFFKLYGDLPKQGPGSEASTLKALSSITDYQNFKHILDIGCGTGRHTLLLAKNTSAQITGVEFYDQQIATLTQNINQENFLERIQVIKQDMADLTSLQTKFDLIWSESSIYNIGFESGLKSWRELVKEGGYLAVSEAVWLTDKPAQEVKKWWEVEYLGMQTVSQNLAIIERSGYDLLTHFVLPKNDWWEGYYVLLEERVIEFQNKKLNDEEQKIIAMTKTEIDMFKQYSDQYGYAFFIMRKN